MTKNGHVTVEFAPTLANTPMKEAWTWGGHAFNLTCRAEAIPNATISWFKDERNLENDPNVQFNVFNGESTITVSPLSSKKKKKDPVRISTSPNDPWSTSFTLFFFSSVVQEGFGFGK